MTSTKDRRGTVDWSSFPDTGCDESPTCLKCPLPVCKHDDPDHGFNKRNWSHEHRKAKYARIFELVKQGVPRREIERALKVSSRTIKRATQMSGVVPDPPKWMKPEDPAEAPKVPVDKINSGYKRRVPSFGTGLPTLSRCGHCGGTVAPRWGDNTCLQCGRAS